MKSIIEEVYIHQDKESNFEVQEKADEQGFNNTDKLLYLGYEVEFEVEIFEDSSNRVLKINGIDVSDKNIKL